jgi:hypothetical protein
VRDFPGSPWEGGDPIGKVFATDNFPSWDCKNTGAGGGGSVPANNLPAGVPGSQEACWVAPTLPGAKPGQIPHLLAATYPNK